MTPPCNWKQENLLEGLGVINSKMLRGNKKNCSLSSFSPFCAGL